MEAQNQRIREMSMSDAPRNKLSTENPAELSIVELLALLIGPGNAQCNSIALAKKVMPFCKNRLTELCKCSVNDLMQVPGIGRSKACALVAFAELNRRQQSEKAAEKPIVRNSKDAATFFRPHLEHLCYEKFAVMFLRQNGQIIAFQIVPEGGITSASVDVRRIFREALKRHAVSIVVSHNHPSGSLQPSIADEALTAKLNSGSKYLDIKLLDHVIIGEGGYFSFADEGKL